jgi:hypothetical protein
VQIWEVIVGFPEGGNLLEQLKDHQRLLKKTFLHSHSVGWLGKLLLVLASKVNHGFGFSLFPKMFACFEMEPPLRPGEEQSDYYWSLPLYGGYSSVPFPTRAHTYTHKQSIAHTELVTWLLC